MGADPRREVLRRDSLAAAEGDGPFDGILQFTDISGKRVAPEQGHGLIGKTVDPFSHVRGESGQKAACEHLDVLGAVPKRGNFQGEGFEPVEEVFAKAPFLDFSGEILVGGRDDPDIDLLFLVAADGSDSAVLQDPQELGLERKRHFRDFIEKQASPFGFGEKPLARFAGAGEGAGGVAEKFAFHERFRYARAVYGKKRAVLPVAFIMQRPGHQFLAGAAFARNEHGACRRCHLLDLVEQNPHGTALSVHAVKCFNGEHAAEAIYLVSQHPGFQDAADPMHEMVQVQRLCQKIVGTGL